MSYLLYKLKFPKGLHIGTDNAKLEETMMTVPSDTFFSALFSEYMKLYGDDELLNLVKDNIFKLSDLLPFKQSKVDTVFYLPKPYINNVEREENIDIKEEDATDRKKVKKLSYIPTTELSKYIQFLKTGKNFPEIDGDFGVKELNTKNKITRDSDGDTEIYNVEIFRFNELSGLYFIVELPEEYIKKFENVLDSLSISGIGGKKTSGYGCFEYEKVKSKIIKENFEYLFKENKESQNYILLSTYLPEKEEISKLKNEKNGYQIIKRSGFVNTSSYSSNPQKRKQVYMVSSGAVLNFKPKGKLVNLKLNGNHSIWRNGKPIVIGVDYE